MLGSVCSLFEGVPGIEIVKPSPVTVSHAESEAVGLDVAEIVGEALGELLGEVTGEATGVGDP
jgi:hypothetical protein